MRKILIFVFSAMLLVCSCKKSTPTNNLLDLHDVKIYPGESVTITASCPCDWEKAGRTEKVNSTSYTFISEDKVTVTTENVSIVAYSHVDDIPRKEVCHICINPSYRVKYFVDAARYNPGSEKWDTSTEGLYIYREIPDQYYLLEYFGGLGNKAYKVTANPNYRSSGTTPDLSYPYMCTIKDKDTTVYLKF